MSSSLARCARLLATEPGPPWVIYVANQGMGAVGTSQVQALQITEMADKTT